MRIVIVEDHLMFRDVLRKVCTEELRHEVVGETHDGKRAVGIITAESPDLVLLDLHLPGLDGFTVLDEVRKVSPRVRVLILSSHCDEYTVFRAERARVQGFVDKNTSSVAALKLALEAIDAGRVWYSEAFQKTKASRLKDPKSFDKVLAEKERGILILIAKGLDDAAIAKQLDLSVATVEKHRFNIFRKLELRSTADLMRYAQQRGFTLSAAAERDGSLLP